MVVVVVVVEDADVDVWFEVIVVVELSGWGLGVRDGLDVFGNTLKFGRLLGWVRRMILLLFLVIVEVFDVFGIEFWVF